MEKKFIYAMYWDNYMGNGYVDKIEITEHTDIEALRNHYWSLHDTYAEADYALTWHLCD